LSNIADKPISVGNLKAVLQDKSIIRIDALEQKLSFPTSEELDNYLASEDI
jgi:hypothetical protein